MEDALGSVRHPAWFYRSDDEYLNGVVPFVLEGLDGGEPVVIAVPGPRLPLLEKALEARAAEVRLVDMLQAGRNPGAILPVVMPASGHTGPVRIVAEQVWPGRSAAEYPACLLHEALVEPALAGRAIAMLCPYDRAELSAGVLADAERTHPELWSPRGRAVSPRYDPAAVRAELARPLGHPDGVEEHPFDVRQLAPIRRSVELWAGGHGLDRPRRDDLVLAIAELTTNSVLYGGGSGVLRLWAGDGQVIAEVTDAGTITEPLAGRIPPAPGALGGRGLLLVNRLADLVCTHWVPGRTTTRVHFRR